MKTKQILIAIGYILAVCYLVFLLYHITEKVHFSFIEKRVKQECLK